MRIIALSDIHLNFNAYIPNGDMLIFAGDFSRFGTMVDYARFLNWIKSLPHKHKIVIAGNHDFTFEIDAQYARNSINCQFIYLENEQYEVEGLKIYGSPYTLAFNNWAFQLYSSNSAKKCWDKIPLDTDILITHSPPFGILDKSSRNGKTLFLGCKKLNSRVKLIHPKIHIFGHVHCNNGFIKQTWDNGDQTLFINASLCDNESNLNASPIVLDYCEKTKTFEVIDAS